MRSLVRRRTILTSALALVAMAASAAPAPAQTATPRVIGGGDVAISKYPFQVRLSIRDGSSTFLCGGSIIDPTHVVTAAHCVTNETTHLPVLASGITVHYGSSSTSSQRFVAASALRVPTQYTATIGRVPASAAS